MTYTHQLLGHRGCSRASPRPFWCDPQARCCTASTSAHDRQQLRVCTWRDAQHWIFICPAATVAMVRAFSWKR